MNKKIIYSIFILFNCVFFLTACRSIKEIPVQTVEKLVYKDSLIYIKDTLKIEIPKETIKEIIPDIDTSYLKTTLAESVAYLDTTERKLCHSLTQHGEITIKYDTIVKVQYVDRVIEKDVPVKVDVVKYKRDALFWVLVAWAILCMLYAGLKIYLKKFI